MLPEEKPISPDCAPAAEPQSEGTQSAAGQVTVPASSGVARANTVGLWLRDVLIAVAASVLIIVFLYQPVRVEGTSMLPRLEDRDRLFINKFVYHFEGVHRGDVVVFHYPRDPEKSYIKRVIALPGDRLRIDRGEVYVNGK